MDDPAPPPGFVPARVGGPFIDLNGPIYARHDAEGLALGFRVAERHLNGAGTGACHGGWLATVMDMLLAIGSAAACGLQDRALLTIAFSADYLGPAPLGAWVEGRAQVLKRTQRLVFVQALLATADGPVLRGSGTFRIGHPVTPFVI